MRKVIGVLAAIGIAVLAASAPALGAPWIEIQASPEPPAHVQNPGGVFHAEAWVHDAPAVPHSVVVSITAPDGTELYNDIQSEAEFVSVSWEAPVGLVDGFYTFHVEYSDETDTVHASQRFLLAGVTSNICSYKFIDVDRDGVYTEGVDELAAGWEICVTSPDLGCQTTVEDEWVVCWFFLTPGTYTVCETLQPGYEPTLPACQTIEIASGEIEKVEFGNAIAQGACCFHPGGDCQLLTAAECEAGGTYLGDDEECEPNPCEPTAAESRTWGQLKDGLRR